MAQLKRYNGTSWEIVGGTVAEDTLPINAVVEYTGSTVPIGYELVEDYSTGEIKTNKLWTDGRPIYSKILKFTTSSTTGQWVNQSHNISNLDTDTFRVISAFVKVNETENNVTNEYVPSKGFQLGVNSSDIKYAMAEAKFKSKNMTMEIEYCKTTD